jgi:hypothetical protein
MGNFKINMINYKMKTMKNLYQPKKTIIIMKTKHLLSLAFLIVFGLGASSLHAQSTTSPDTVCAGKTGASYYVTKTVGSVYHWIVPNGTIASGNNTDSITVNWSSTSGTDTIDVVEINAHGCIGDTQKLAVYRMPLPTATISGVDSLCWTNTSNSFTVNFTGIGPWNITYTDGTTSTPVNNIASNPYTINLGHIATTKTYTITAVSNKFGCSGSTSGSGSHVFVVNPKPATSAIFHK